MTIVKGAVLFQHYLLSRRLLAL